MKNIILYFLLNILSVVYGQTEISGTISTNTTWSTSGSPYIISGGITISNNATLSIQSGVVVNFTNWDRYIYIESGSTLNANNVTFNSDYAYEDYNTIRCNGNLSLDNCTMNKATINLYGDGSESHSISNSTFDEGFIFINNTPSTIINNSFTVTVPIRFVNNLPSPTISGNTFAPNSLIQLGRDNILTVSKNSTLPIYQGLSYFIYKSIHVTNNSTFTITPGAILELTNWDRYIYIESGSTLNANNVTFNSDYAYEDYNTIRCNGNLSLDNCTMNKATINLYGDGKINNSDFVNMNAKSAITNHGSNIINAENNYWGSPNGPTHSSNSNGDGAKVSDNVDFVPFSTSPINFNEINLEIFFSRYYNIWGNPVDQNRLALLVGIKNNSTTATVYNVSISATLDGQPLEILLNSDKFTDIYQEDKNNDGLIDKIAPNGSSVFLIKSQAYSNYFENKGLVVNVTQVDGEQTNISKSENISMYFAKQTDENRPFTLGIDQYNFDNWTKPTVGDIINLYGRDKGGTLLLATLSSWNGHCYGMAGSSGRYFIEPSSKPYQNINTYQFDFNDSRITTAITDYHILQMGPNFKDIFVSVDNSEEYQKLLNNIKNYDPSLIAINKTGKNGGHAVLGTKLTVLNNSNEAYLGLYENNSAVMEGVALYSKSSNNFDYNGYDKLRIDDIPPALGTVVTDLRNPLTIFLSDVATNLFEDGFKIFSTACPVNMYTENSLGQKVGVLPDGSYLNEIPNSKIIRIATEESSLDSVTVVFVPKNENYKVNISGYGEGTMRYESYNPTSNTQMDINYADSIEVTSSTIATVDENNSNNIDIDNNGDGIIDTTVSTNTNVIVTSVQEERVNYIPSEFSLEQNYPNPFNPTTTITYNIAEATHLELEVFDLLGRKVAVLVNGYKNPGSYNVIFNAENLTSGFYIYRLKTDKYTMSKKLLLLK